MPETKVLLPQFGMGMQEAEIVEWFKKPGDEVKEGEALLEVEAAKSVEEVPAPVSGTLSEIVADQGDVVEVRSVIAIIQT